MENYPTPEIPAPEPGAEPIGSALASSSRDPPPVIGQSPATKEHVSFEAAKVAEGSPTASQGAEDQEQASQGTDDTDNEFLVNLTTVDTEAEKELENEERDRATWGKRLEFILASVAAAVGLGNIWRFPAVCYQNGGGAFLIPYVSCVLILGFPLFFMEMAIGQYASLAPVAAFKRMMPAFQGIGIAIAMSGMITAIYYNTVIAWCLFYVGSSVLALFSNQHFDFGDCRSDSLWASAACVTDHQKEECGNGTVYYNFTCVPSDAWNQTKSIPSTQEYFS